MILGDRHCLCWHVIAFQNFNFLLGRVGRAGSSTLFKTLPSSWPSHPSPHSLLSSAISSHLFPPSSFSSSVPSSRAHLIIFITFFILMTKSNTIPSLPTPSSIISLENDYLHSLEPRCICHLIAEYIVESVKKTESLPYYVPSVDYLSLEIKKSTDMSVEHVEKLCSYLFNICQLEYECLVSILIYLQRMEKLSPGKFRLTRSNWKISLLLCTMTSSKMLDDFSMENRDFSIAFDVVTLPQLNHFEVLFLDMLQYHLCISIDEYQTCYDDLVSRKKIAEGVNVSLLQFQPLPSLNDSPKILRKPSLDVQTKSQTPNSQLVSPQSITSSSSFDSPSFSPTAFVHPIELLSMTLRHTSISEMLFSCFERDVEV